MEHGHKRAEFLEKYLELVNCDMSDGNGLLRDMSRHIDVVTDRDAFNSLKEWHEVSHFSINQFARGAYNSLKEWHEVSHFTINQFFMKLPRS